MRLGMVLVATALLGAMSCQNLSLEVSGGPGGRVLLALVVAGGSTISSVSWTIASSANRSIASGTTNTSGAGATVSFAVGLPAGIGDVVSMTAVTSAGTICAGSSDPFDVTVNQTVAVKLTLSCQSTAADGGLGSVVVSGTVVPGDSCPALSAWTISPQTVAANGGQVDVSATATDTDGGDTLTYAWSASAGTFASAASSATTYTCATAGTQVLELTVSDDHTPIPCSIQVSFPPVTCD